MSMLEEQIPQTPETPPEATQEPDWSDSSALEIVRQDFDTAENFRRSNHDPRWHLADALYLGYEKQRVWKGTKIPRSSLSMFVVFQQVESMLPKVVSTIFSDNPWFEVGPQPGTTGKDAIDVRDLMLHQMEMARRYKNQSIREVIRRGVKSGFLYGAGIVEICWEDQFRKVRKLARQEVPEMASLYGMPMPTGRTRQMIAEQIFEKREQYPYCKNISVKDFFIDPNCESPQIQMGQYAIKRAYMTKDEIKRLSPEAGFIIPPDPILDELCDKKLSSQSDMSKRWAESAREVDWSPEVDSSIAPGAKTAEVLAYWRYDRCVWTINREVVLFNQENSYGFVPFFNAFYVDVPDRFYGMSIADVTEGEHRLQGALVNGRVDETALTIHGTTVKKRGFSIPNSQLQRKPGQIIEADNPKEDIVFGQTQNITQQAVFEVAASELRVQKTTGVSDLAIAGTPTSGGNSANRTATGVGAQVNAAFSRLSYTTQTIEDTFVEPILTASHTLNTLFLSPDDVLSIMDPYGTERNIDPLRILNADVLFKMRASSKLQSKMMLMQQFPALAQAAMNPRFVETLAMQGQTVDWAEFFQIFVDATGYAMRGKLIRPMTPQEQQAFEKAQNEEQNLKLQMQRERMKDIETDHQMERMADLQKVVVEKSLDAALSPDEDQSGE